MPVNIIPLRCLSLLLTTKFQENTAIILEIKPDELGEYFSVKASEKSTFYTAQHTACVIDMLHGKRELRMSQERDDEKKII
jgi:hypothetical protein